MTWFETEKRKANIAAGFNETKGLLDGRCNRRDCQAPLGTEPLRCSMRDHELNSNERLYYCMACAILFDVADADGARQDRAVGRTPHPPRITREAR